MAQDSYLVGWGKPLTRRERLRRVVILCASFARNVAYFRAGQSEPGSEVRGPTHAGPDNSTYTATPALPLVLMKVRRVKRDPDWFPVMSAVLPRAGTICPCA